MDALAPEHEAEWQRLRAQLELAQGFWLGFVFAEHSGIAAILRVRTTRLLRARALACVTLEPAAPDELSGALDGVFAEAPKATGCLFLQCVSLDSTGTGPWRSAWEQLLLRSNERRDALRRALPGGLVFVLPRSFKALVRDAAPDLWSVRALVVELIPVVSTGRDARAYEHSMELQRHAVTEPAPDPQLAEEEAARLTHPGSKGIALRRAAEGHLARGAVQEAIRTASAALAQLAQAPREAYAREVALARLGLGRAEQRDGDAGAAREHLEAALGALGSDVPQVRIQALDALAAALLASGEFGAAEQTLAEAVALLRGQGETREALRDLSIGLDKLGKVMRQRGNVDGALDVFQESLVLSRRLLSDFGETPLALRDLAVSLDNLGEVMGQRGKLDAALAASQESLVLRRRLLSDFGETPLALRDLAVSLDNLGDVMSQREKLDETLAVFQESLVLRRRLLSDFGETPQALRDLSVSLDRLGDVTRQRGKLDEALAVFQESLALRRRLLSDFGETPQALRDLSISLNNLGDVLGQRGKVDEALFAFQESLVLSRRLLSDFGETPEALRDLSISLNKLGNVMHQRGSIDEALAAVQESLVLRRRLLSDFGETPEALRDLSLSLDSLGAVMRQRGKLDEALTAFQESLALTRRVLTEYSETPQAREDFAVSLRLVARSLSELGDTAGAEALQRELHALEARA